MPSLVGTFPGTRCGRPFASKPSIQFTFTYGLPEQELAGRAIEHVHQAVAIRPQHHLARLPAERDVGEHRHLRRVVVELVVRRELVMPLQLARIGVERDARCRCTGCRRGDCGRPNRARDCRCPRTSGSSRDRRRPRSTRRRRPSSTSRPTTCRCRARRDQESCRSATLPCRSSRRTPRSMPRMPMSPPAVPTITLSFTMSGACVIE